MFQRRTVSLNSLIAILLLVNKRDWSYKYRESQNNDEPRVEVATGYVKLTTDRVRTTVYSSAEKSLVDSADLAAAAHGIVPNTKNESIVRFKLTCGGGRVTRG